jgi:hypothetical protein
MDTQSISPDFILENHGSNFLLSPPTDAARTWIDEHISREGFQPYWPTVAVEFGYVESVIQGIRKDGRRWSHLSG